MSEQQTIKNKVYDISNHVFELQDKLTDAEYKYLLESLGDIYKFLDKQPTELQGQQPNQGQQPQVEQCICTEHMFQCVRNTRFANCPNRDLLFQESPCLRVLFWYDTTTRHLYQQPDHIELCMFPNLDAVSTQVHVKVLIYLVHMIYKVRRILDEFYIAVLCLVDYTFRHWDLVLTNERFSTQLPLLLVRILSNVSFQNIPFVCNQYIANVANHRIEREWADILLNNGDRSRLANMNTDIDTIIRNIVNPPANQPIIPVQNQPVQPVVDPNNQQLNREEQCTFIYSRQTNTHARGDRCTEQSRNNGYCRKHRHQLNRPNHL